MQLHVEPVSEMNREDIVKIHLAEGQEGFVETVEECLSEAKGRSDWRPVGIFDGNVPVGFAMYGYFHEYKPHGRVWLDRLLIDESQQRKGYGTKALEILLHRIREEYQCQEIYLSVIEKNYVATKMYQKIGFAFIGEKDIHGEDVMKIRLTGRE